MIVGSDDVDIVVVDDDDDDDMTTFVRPNSYT